MEPNKFSPEHIKHEFLTLTSEYSYSEDCLETKLQAKFDRYDQIFEQPEEELINVIEQKHQKSELIEEELFNINSKTLCLSEATEVINEVSVKPQS